VDIYSKTNIHEEILRRITTGNKYYFSFVELFNSKNYLEEQKLG